MKQENELKLREKWLCLDFANTNDWHTSAHPVESLFSYSDLTAWCRKVGLISPEEAQDLASQVAKSPAEAGAILNRAIELREAIYQVVTCLCDRKICRGCGSWSLVNEEISLGAVYWKLKPAPGGFAWGWETATYNLAAVLGPIARSAADLLTSPELQRVGICADEDGCGFVFYDTSRNRSRRWCSMEDCGNRAKAQRHYQRQRVAGT